MSADNGAALPLIEEEEGIRQYGDIEASDRRRRKDIDRQSARAVKGGATRGSYRKLALAATMLATVGVAFALLITAVELSKEDDTPTYDLGLDRSSPQYLLFLASAGKLLPGEVHATLPEDAIGPGRLIIIGDVHGCVKELKELLEEAEYVEGEDTVVLVGDLVDKGPYPLEVLAEARRLKFHSVRGNHDDEVLAAYEALARGKHVPGGKKWVKDLPAAAAQWLHALPFSLRIPSYGVTVVHAGIVPDVPLERQSLGDMYLMREVVNGTNGRWRAEEAKCDRGHLGPPWAAVWDGPEHIYFGHDHQRGLQERPYATGLDTGCCYGDRLTAAVLPALKDLKALGDASGGRHLDKLGAKIISVPAHEKYYDVDPCD
ncbi:Metallo-dependent phosphatase [Coccomyxa subellipsoidea C-169]|uniref:Metallo-dependent phosphatase n=1 Tax=Coccomyxa subellipsoidea (strain C-169) TaxID=574566 RepID=I0YK19_COCSC|nr:Metallo-dependent phosphatase [Coccomyxa subellipsoidea C-169]EIE18738.1 Metallo-dependent phosphatase [Coccomyxa subellipsoidea C-169]|eukprot:XP_005643282.1 Metallo-dependent phosphatase [Coccomyxa subellipsoidea C-169]